MDIDQLVSPQIAAAQTITSYSGKVSRLVGTDAFVTVPALSLTHEHGPCRVTSGAAAPAEGTDVLVTFDEASHPWIVGTPPPVDLSSYATTSALTAETGARTTADSALDGRLTLLETSHYCILGLSAGVGMGAGGVVPWSSEIADPRGMHATNGTQLIVDKAGVWEVFLTVVGNITPIGASTFSAFVLKNALAAGDAPGGSTLMQAVAFGYRVSDSGPMVLASGDALTVTVSQNSGQACTIQPGSRLGAVYRGAA